MIERSGGLPVGVDFWATWCRPRRTLSPLLEREAAKRAGFVGAHPAARLGEFFDERLLVACQAGAVAGDVPGASTVGPMSISTRMFRARKRLEYRGGRPGLAARMQNRFWGWLFGAGIAGSRAAVLEVRGRTSGDRISLPVAIVSYEGERYLVAMLGPRRNGPGTFGPPADGLACATAAERT